MSTPNMPTNSKRWSMRSPSVGAKVKEIEPKLDTARLHEVYVLLLRAATSARTRKRMSSAGGQTLSEIGAAKEPYLDLMVRGNTLPHRDWLKLNNERHGLRRTFAAFFADYDILLCPAAASAAWPHDQEGERWQRKITGQRRSGRHRPISYSGQAMRASSICRRRWALPVLPSQGYRSAIRRSPQAVVTRPRPPSAASSKRKSLALFRRPASTERCPCRKARRADRSSACSPSRVVQIFCPGPLQRVQTCCP